MPVRAKFKVSKIEATMGSMPGPNKDANGRAIYIPTVIKTVVLNPVFGNGDPNHENTKFWAASPSGEIRLGTVNAQAAAQFELDQEFYVDFTPSA